MTVDAVQLGAELKSDYITVSLKTYPRFVNAVFDRIICWVR